MITAKLYGGLGNQMFQISTAYSLSKDNNDICAFNFNDCQTLLQGNSSKKYIKNIFKNLNEIYDYNSFKNFYKETQFSFVDITYKENLIIDGYFQSYKYFENNYNDIKNLFHFSDVRHEITFDNKNFTYISVHIRRGDYLKFPTIHTLCDINYYNQSINFFQKKFNNCIFIFFSDDIEWVKNNFKSENYIYSEKNDEIYDLSMMIKCDHNIIANSTFSWWGAYLNDNITKEVISPKRWFGNDGVKDTEDLYLKNWIKI